MAKTQSNIEKFLALPDAENQAEAERAARAEGKPLTPAQRETWDQVQAELKVEYRSK